jgi:hypothetical protein
MMLHYVEAILRAADAPALGTGHVGPAVPERDVQRVLVDRAASASAGVAACADPRACPRCVAERDLYAAARARREARDYGWAPAGGVVALGSVSREEAQTLVAAAADHEQACEALGYTSAAQTCRGLLRHLRKALRLAGAADSAA